VVELRKRFNTTNVSIKPQIPKRNVINNVSFSGFVNMSFVHLSIHLLVSFSFRNNEMTKGQMTFEGTFYTYVRIPVHVHVLYIYTLFFILFISVISVHRLRGFAFLMS